MPPTFPHPARPPPFPRLFTHSSLPGSHQDLRFLFALLLAVARARALTWQQLGRGRCGGTQRHVQVCISCVCTRECVCVCVSSWVPFIRGKNGISHLNDGDGDQRRGEKLLNGSVIDSLAWLKAKRKAHNVPLCIVSLNSSTSLLVFLPTKTKRTLYLRLALQIRRRH